MALRRPSWRLPSMPTVLRRLLWASAAVLVVAVLLGGPVRSWLAQRDDIAEVEAQLAAIDADNAELRQRLSRMSDPVAVEEAARRDLGMVREGEESYSVLPPATAGLVLPRAWPFEDLAGAIVAGRAAATAAGTAPAAGAPADRTSPGGPTAAEPTGGADPAGGATGTDGATDTTTEQGG
jgi:cell division protein FtsB